MPRSRKSRYAPEYRTLIDLLIELRNEADVTQVELAKRMGTSQSVLSKLERGVVRMDLMDVLDYLDGIHADPRQFLDIFLGRIEFGSASPAPAVERH
ncbi:helix-turn-helix domain-containing protein [Solimonas marina]|uniref:Helix-turn-helix transcriptional regulator n=1 Tax=Solimonas marina TaxID=2714601 RepID=A0A970BBK7_9GAMM|nr:helix-turn-helix transcriptional regulator [Solimonas marina]NKF24546.1 helix-turn-helix transcriptional regulator [Solimonas marina]